MKFQVESEFGRWVMSKLLKILVQVFLGCRADVKINDLSLASGDGSTKLHIDLDATASNVQIGSMVKRLESKVLDK